MSFTSPHRVPSSASNHLTGTSSHARGGGGSVMVLDQSPIHPPIGGGASTASHGSSVLHHSQLTEIQMELELLKERRKALEQQRKLLIRTTDPVTHHQSGKSSAAPVTPQPDSFRHRSPPVGVHNSSTRSSSVRSARSASRSNRSRSMDQKQFIPTERERRERIARNIYLEMKESMRRSWESDSTLVGGFFGQTDNRVSTFGRERRFTPITGMKSSYHLATDVEEMQRTAAEQTGKRYLTASSRGRPGCNVLSNWNDSRGGTAPGPGAYTPRFQKVAKPSILVSRLN